MIIPHTRLVTGCGQCMRFFNTVSLFWCGLVLGGNVRVHDCGDGLIASYYTRERSLNYQFEKMPREIMSVTLYPVPGCQMFECRHERVN